MPEMRIVDCRGSYFARVDIPVIITSDLSTHEKMVYVALCAFAAQNDTCFPSVETLAGAASCSKRQVFRCLEVLEEVGLIARKQRFKDKEKISNVYEIRGSQGAFKGKKRKLAEIPPGDSQSLPPSDSQSVPSDSQSHRTRSTELDRNKSYSPSESTEESVPDTQPVIEDEPKTPEEDAPLCSPEDAPAPMGATVDYFLLKTGRSGISAAELSAVRALEKRHTPARIQTEIGKAVARYQKAGRVLASLSLEYIWEALKHQTSLPGARKAKAEQKRRVEEDPAEKQRLADLEDWERRQHEELMAKYGGEDV